MTGLVRETFNLNLKILRALGLFPNPKYKSLYKTYAICIYIFFISLVPLSMAAYLFVADDVTMETVSDGGFIIFQCGSFIYKLLPFIYNADEVRKVLYSLENPIFNSYTKEQRIFIDRFIEKCKRNTDLFLGFCVGSLILWGGRPIALRRQTFPTLMYTPYDPYQSNLVYVSTYIYSICGIAEGAITNGVLDPLVAGLLIFAACQVDILKDNLQNLDKDIMELMGNNSHLKKSDIIYERIQKCVAHHNAILDFVESFEKTFSQVVFSQFIASVSVICITIFQMSMVSPASFIFFQMTIFFITMLIEIYLYCYYGTCLYDKSNSLINSIYIGNWYEYDKNCQKALITIMERAKKPMKVTAGKVLDLSLETFTTILRRSYSLLAVLKNY